MERPVSLGRLSRLLLPLLVSAVLPVTLAAQSKAETHLTIDVHLTQQAHGELAYLVFASPSGFPGDRDKALRHGFLPIPSNAQHLHIDTDLPPGTYAVSVYEDLNSNHKLDHNLIGIPREPVGVSIILLRVSALRTSTSVRFTSETPLKPSPSLWYTHHERRRKEQTSHRHRSWARRYVCGHHACAQRLPGHHS